MFASLKLFPIVLSLFFVNCIRLVPLAGGETGDCIDDAKLYFDGCKAQTSFFLSNQQSMQISLYYNPGSTQPDYSFIKTICKARQNLKNVCFSLIPGVSETRSSDGHLQCPKNGIDPEPCLYPILDACASKLVNDFTEFVCCFYFFDTKDDQADTKCIAKQNADKVEEYKSCIKDQHPTIKPDKVLLDNSKAANDKFPHEHCRHPFLTFNGQTEEKCTRNAFLYEPVRVICAMLAPGVEDTCNK